MSKNLKFPLESRADGEGKLARRRNIKSASFHARSDSEIYTTEYVVALALATCNFFQSKFLLEFQKTSKKSDHIKMS